MFATTAGDNIAFSQFLFTRRKACTQLREESSVCRVFRRMMNKIFLGFEKDVSDLLPKGNFLLLHDDVPEIPDWQRPQVFDPTRHSFNPLQGLDYKRARELAVVLYSLYPQGENTLTVRNGQRLLLKALLSAKHLDELDGDDEVLALRDDLLASPILRDVLCRKENNSTFRSVVLARINRKELGEFDALALGLFLINHYKGQLVIPDFGFYGRNAHTRLIREERLIAGINYLDELPLQLRRAILSVKDVEHRHVRYEDALELAKYHCSFLPGTDGHSTFVQQATGLIQS